MIYSRIEPTRATAVLRKDTQIVHGCYGFQGKVGTALTMHFRQGSFFRNLSIVMSGTAFAQLVSFALMPVVGRLFTPADFGIFGSYNAILSVLCAFVTLQYTQAIVLPESKEDALNLFLASCLSVAMVAGLCVVVTLAVPERVQALVPSLNGWMSSILIVAVVVEGLNQSLLAWCIRVKAFVHTSASHVVRSFSAVAIWTVAGIGNTGAMGLVFGSVCAEILASLSLSSVLTRDLKQMRVCVKWARIRELAKDFRDFPAFAAPQNFMNALSQGLPVLLLGQFYGIGAAGAYAFGAKILQAPMQLVLTPLRQVLLQKASETHNESGNLQPLFLKTTGGLMVLASLPTVVLFIWAPQIFSSLFGREWCESGTYARWMILWIFAGFSNLPSVLFARVLRQQRNLFLFECISLSLRTMVLIVGGCYWSAITTVISFSMAGLLLNLALILWIGLLVSSSQRATP